jgi:pyoverdine/dityrosine biosynthesis protein Dit1
MSKFVSSSHDGDPVVSCPHNSELKSGNDVRRHLPLCDSKTENRIAGVLLRHRKPLLRGCSLKDCETCENILAVRFKPFVEENSSIPMVISAFPYKIPNETKTVSNLPDASEYHALASMAKLCREISMIYPPGAHIVIGSDGLPFHHLDASYSELSVSQVRSYVAALKEMVSRLGAADLIKVVSMDDYFVGDPEHMRQELEKKYAPKSRDQVYEEFKNSPMYAGIKKAFSEDLLDAASIQKKLAACTLSKKAVKKQAGELAVETVFYSIAWRNFLSAQFPNAIRLSIHPECLHITPFGAEKFGIGFGETPSVWFAQKVLELNETTDISPWQSVWVEDSVSKDGCRMKRWVAEAIGARLQIVNGQPSHFVIYQH